MPRKQHALMPLFFVQLGHKGAVFYEHFMLLRAQIFSPHCPSLDGGGGGALGEESEKDESKDDGKGVGLTPSGAGIGHLGEALPENCQRRHGRFEGKSKATQVRPNMVLR